MVSACGSSESEPQFDPTPSSRAQAPEHLLAVADKICSMDPEAGWAEIIYDGMAINMADKGTEGRMECMLNNLGAPISIHDQISRTVETDDAQNATWGKYRVYWQYYPEAGLLSMIEVVS